MQPVHGGQLWSDTKGTSGKSSFVFFGDDGAGGIDIETDEKYQFIDIGSPNAYSLVELDSTWIIVTDGTYLKFAQSGIPAAIITHGPSGGLQISEDFSDAVEAEILIDVGTDGPIIVPTDADRLDFIDLDGLTIISL